MHTTHTASALLLALSLSHAAWARDAAVATAPALSARQQALMATVVGSAAHPRIRRRAGANDNIRALILRHKSARALPIQRRTYVQPPFSAKSLSGKRIVQAPGLQNETNL